MFRKVTRTPKAGSNPGYVLPPDNEVQEPDGNSPKAVHKARKLRKPHPIRNGILATSLCFLAFIFITSLVWDIVVPFTGGFARPASELIFELPAGLLVYRYFRKKRPTESIHQLVYENPARILAY